MDKPNNKFNDDRFDYEMFKMFAALLICFAAEAMMESNSFFYGACAVIICMFDSKVRTGVLRILGVFFGTALAAAVIVLSKMLNIYLTNIYFVFAALMIVPIMYIPFLLKKKLLISTAGFTFMAVAINCNVDMDGWQNILEIMAAFTMGAIIVMLLNLYVPTAKPDSSILFVSDLDGTLLNKNKQISILSMGIINRLIRNGMNFTIATARTPATVINILKDINLRLPVICMNGSVIYDVKEKKYLYLERIESEAYLLLETLVKRNTSAYIIQCVENDFLNLYYNDFNNEALKNFYEERKELTHKRFIKGLPSDSENVVSMMVLEEAEKAEKLYSQLVNCDFAKKLSIIKYNDVYNKDFMYIEVYSEKTSKTAAINYIKKLCRAEKTVAFGDNDNDADMLKNADMSFAVKNATELAKKSCRRIIGSNERDSVAQTLRTFRFF